MRITILEKLIKKNPDLFRGAILYFLRNRKEAVLKDLKEIEKKIKEMEEKYGNYEDFIRTMDDTFESHETWIEWRSLIELKNELKKELKEIDEAYRELIEETP